MVSLTRTGVQIAVVTTPGFVSRHGQRHAETNHTIQLNRGKHLRCSCGGDACYRTHTTSPGVLGSTCWHIHAMYGERSGPRMEQLTVAFTARGHALFDSIWAALLLLKE